ncbi:MarR family transcriptional regulator [Geotalea sp. SG265]|uniref:MarR family winged helix-turn-helix transcriptional regulator n=1 Tax=Geotalea sp. SG265 TaxID=2922867 RepID=UPI001FAF9FB1|nr:MarR family transcriptional regulator [Geotalea sp. SG265]
MIDMEKNVGFLLAKAYQRASAIFKEEFEGYELTPQQFGLLGFLWQEDGLSQAELSARSQIDRTTIGGLIGRLEKEGLVKRLVHPHDRRAYQVCLTELGKAMEDQLAPLALKTLARFTAPLTDREVETLRHLLNKLRS